jgi:spermidine synthase
MLWYFVFFFISGFCGILYELIWLRLAIAQFGVTTALVSIVLSMFMAGLGAGSLGAGILLRRNAARIAFPPLRLYALTELLIACSALAVPYELLFGHRLLAHMASATLFSSIAYYLISGACLGLTLVPWCAGMGATIPLAMFAIRRAPGVESQRSFSFLYLSNVMGAAAGAVAPLFLIESRGFHSTLRIGAVLNCTVALAAFALSFVQKASGPVAAPTPPAATPVENRRPLVLLFMTGLASMGMEVVWIRLFTPYISVVVYSFATILVVYLFATSLGSAVYRASAHNAKREGLILWSALALFTVLPLLASDPRVPLGDIVRVLTGIVAFPRAAGYLAPAFRVWLGIAAFSGAAGYLTPKLVDRWAGGDPDRAAHAYAINVLGCILGPLLAGFLLLPLLSERWVLLVFAAPWLFVGASSLLTGNREATAAWRPLPVIIFGMLTLAVFMSSRSFESIFDKRVVLRDNTATIVATGDGMDKRLLVNGVGITSLTPITKAMAHFPLAFLDRPPQKVLVICFGMGTTFRSLLSWGRPTTAVDLVPSVPKMFWYYHSDAPELLRSPLSHVIVDDGRRYLERTSDQYDLITIDPPPPVEAAGSSLLYSKEFYAVAKMHLAARGILQQWLPDTDDRLVRSSVAQAIQQSFSHVRVFHSLEDNGYHFLASDWQLPDLNAHQMAQKLPPAAASDFVEWGPEDTPEGQFEILLRNEFPLSAMIAGSPNAPPLQDDRPMNEYFALRILRHTRRGAPDIPASGHQIEKPDHPVAR